MNLVRSSRSRSSLIPAALATSGFAAPARGGLAGTRLPRLPDRRNLPLECRVILGIRKQQVLGSNPSVGSIRSCVKAGNCAGFPVSSTRLAPDLTPCNALRSGGTKSRAGARTPRATRYLRRAFRPAGRFCVCHNRGGPPRGPTDSSVPPPAPESGTSAAVGRSTPAILRSWCAGAPDAVYRLDKLPADGLNPTHRMGGDDARSAHRPPEPRRATGESDPFRISGDWRRALSTAPE